MFMSTKVFDGYSTVFRQWKAENTHCKYLHGYAVSFEVTFEGELDERNWVWDFGGMKRASFLIDGLRPKDWFEHMFDHTVIIAEDDPDLLLFEALAGRDLLRLRVLPATGAERFAEYIFNKLSEFVQNETGDRVKIKRVKFMENGKNSAIYEA